MRRKPENQIEVIAHSSEVERYISAARESPETLKKPESAPWWQEYPNRISIYNVTPALREEVLANREVAFPLFYEVIRNGEDVESRLGLLEVLYRWGDQHAETFLLDFIRTGDEPQIRKSLFIVAHAKAIAPSERLIEAAKPFLRAKDDWLATSAASALIRVASAENIGLLAQIVQDDLEAPALFLELLAPYEPAIVLEVVQRRMGSPEEKRHELTRALIAVIEKADPIHLHNAFRLARALSETLTTEHPTCNYDSSLLRVLSTHGTAQEAEWMQSVLRSNGHTYDRALQLGRLAALGEKVGRAELLEYLKDPGFHDAACKALAVLDRGSGNESSMRAIEQECPDRNRVEKAWAILEIGGKQAIHRALAVLDDPAHYEEEARLGFTWLARGLTGEGVVERLFEVGAIPTLPDSATIQEVRARNPKNEVAVFYECLSASGAIIEWPYEDECFPARHDELILEIASRMGEVLPVQYVRETPEQAVRSRQFVLEFISAGLLYRLRGKVSRSAYDSTAIQALINRVLQEQGRRERLIPLKEFSEREGESFLFADPKLVRKVQAVVDLPLA